MTIREQRPPSVSGFETVVFDAPGDRDRELVLAFLDGDVDAFSIIAHDHYASLNAQARRLLGPSGQSEDAVQETFERALKSLHRFGLTGEYRLGPWLSRILSNVCNDQRARTARQLRLFEAAAARPSVEADVSDRVSDPQTVAIVRNALSELPHAHRRAVVLHEVDGLPYADVAEVENISVENARARVSRGKSSLRRTLNSLKAIVLLPAFRIFGLSDRRLRHLTEQADLVGEKADRLSRSSHGSLVDQLASRIASTPLGQSAFALMTSPPRGTLVFGLAATVATVGASTVLLNQPSPAPVAAAVAAPAPAPALAVSHLPAAPSVPHAAAVVASTPVTSGTGVDPGPPYTWVDPGPPSSVAAVVPLASLPAAASCISANGVAPPAPGFSYGTSLGTSDAVSVGSTPTTVLPTTGASTSFTAPLTVTSFPGATATGGALYDVSASTCLTSSGWFTALITGTGAGGTPVSVQLAGVVQEVIGSPGNLGYIFRGTVSDEGSAAPSLEATQFVAQVVIATPANTAQLTVVFLGGSGTGQSTNGQPTGTNSQSSGQVGTQQTSSSSVGGTSTSTSASDTSTSALPAFSPITAPIATSS